jgi:hypothetical protein
MLSVRLVMVTDSAALSLRTRTVKVKVPPGSGRVRGAASLMTVMTGGTPSRVTTASSVAVAVLPAASVPTAVTTSVWLAPALPVKVPGKEQV